MLAGILEIEMLANVARLAKDMDDAKRTVNGAMASIEKSVETAKAALGGLAAGLSVSAFAGMVRASIDMADNLNDLSKTTGIAIDDLAGLKLAAKQSGGDLDGIAASINKLSVAMGKDAERFRLLGVTAKDPLEAFKQLSDVFSKIDDPQMRAALGAEALGKGWASAAPLLSEGSARIGEMVEKGKALANVNQEMANKADEFNDKMAEMETALQGAKMKLADEMLPAMVEITNAIVTAYNESGKLKALWVSLGAAGAFLYTDEFASTTVKLKDLEKELAKFESRKGSWLYDSEFTNKTLADTAEKIRALKAEIAKPEQDAVAKAAAAAAKKASDAEARSAALKAAEFLKLDDEARKSAAAALRAQNEELKKQQDLLAKLSGYNADYQEQARRLVAMRKTGALTEESYVAAIVDLVQLQPGVIAFEKALEQATKERVASTVRSLNAELDAYYRMRDAIDDVNKSLNELASANASEADALVFEAGLMGQNATERSKAIEQYKILAKYKAEAAKITDTIADPAVRASMLASLAVQQQQAMDNAARAVDIAAWNSTFDRINESLTDALISAGRDGGAALATVLEQELLAKPFKIILQGVMQPVTQGLTSAVSTASGLSNITGVGASAGAGSLSSLLGSSSMGELDIAGFDPYTMAAAAAIIVLSQLGGKFTSASDSGRARIDYSAAGIGGSAYSTTGSAVQIEAMTASTNALAKTYFDTAKSLGISAIQGAFEVGANTGREGASPNTVIGATFGTGSYSSGEISSADTSALALAASRAVLTALQASQLPGYLSGVFNGLTAGSATQDQINTALAYAQSLKTVRDALLETRTPLEVLQANVNTAFATLGTSADSFKADFVAAIDASPTADTLAQWQSLGAALDTLATDAAATAKAATEAAAALLKTNQGWQDQLDVLTGQRSQTQVDRYNALTAVTDASTRALMKQVYAQQDIAAATQATTTSFAAIAASVAGISTSVSDSIFGMQYGMADTSGKYNMLDVKAAGLNDKMLGSTDINTIASLAASQIELLNQSWALLDPTQQQATYLQFEDKLNKIDEYVVSKGADALGLQEAADRRTADTISAAVEKAVEKAMAASASALQAAAEKADRPIVVESRVTVSAPAGSEVSIT